MGNMSNGRQIPATEKIRICLTFVLLVEGFYLIPCCFAGGAEEFLHSPSLRSSLACKWGIL